MKYIVYLTINNASKIDGINRIYVGTHETKDPSTFDGYIGDMVYADQASTYKYPKTPFQCAVKKYGVKAFQRQTLFVYDNIEEAYKKEKEIVNSDFIQQDFVYNAYLGGENILNKTIYQIAVDGKLLKKWTVLDACKFYNLPRHKFIQAIKGKYVLLNSWWSYTLNVDNYSTKQQGARTNLYSLKGKWIREFISRKECAEYLSLSEDIINDAVLKQKPLLGQYYVSDKLTDEFIPKPRRQYVRTKFYLYKDSEYLGEYVGKAIMPIIGCFSWTKISKYLSSNNGWYKDYYISESKVPEVPKRDSSISVDVYTQQGDFIETITDLSDLKEKYNISKAKAKNIQLGDKYFGDYIFKYHSKR